MKHDESIIYIKKILKKILVYSRLLKKTPQKDIKSHKFKTSADYWQKRYESGGNSGAGSYNNLAEFKGETINNFMKEKNIVSMIEFGCGDGNQLKYLTPHRYLGFDVSEKAIELCSELYKDDDTKEFKLISSFNNEKADLSLSLDVLFHLVEDQIYLNYMNNLFEASDKYVIVYSSNTDKNISNAVHVKHRKFTNWIEKNRQDFRFLKYIPNKYPFDGDGNKTSFADFYIFEKIPDLFLVKSFNPSIYLY